MLNIALFGPPGAGKGTQSEYLIEKYKLHYISTGDLLRQEIKDDTRLGKEAKDIIASGKLVPDEIIVQIIEKTISDNMESNGFLFDGFPRTYIQAYILEGLMLQLNTSLDVLISIDVPYEESLNRLLHRGITSGRSDDNDLVIRKRLTEYHEKTIPVLEYYKDRGIYKEVNGMQPIKKVTEAIEDVISGVLSKKLFNVLLFGYPGSGRSSQGLAIAEAYGLEYVDTGIMIDEEIHERTETGQKITELYESGQLLPDELVVPLIEKKLATSKNPKGFIFKGFPRTLVQSYILDGLFKKHGIGISKIIELNVPTLELVRRLDARSKTDQMVPYDTSAAKIVHRLLEHEQKTLPVIERYRKNHAICQVDGTGSFEEVFDRIAFEMANGFKSLR